MPRLRPRVIYDGSRPGAAAGANKEPPDNYVAQIVKHIPAEAITAYQGVAGLLSESSSADRLWWLSVTALACLIFTPLWTLFATREPKDLPAWSQAIVACLAFGIWLLAIDSPAIHSPLLGEIFQQWNQLKGSIVLLIMTTLVFPLLGRILARILKG